MDLTNISFLELREEVCLKAKDCMDWCIEQHVTHEYQGNFLLIASGVFFLLGYILINSNSKNLTPEKKDALFKACFNSGLIFMICYFVHLLYILKGG
jgi:hypothetical protein